MWRGRWCAPAQATPQHRLLELLLLKLQRSACCSSRCASRLVSLLRLPMRLVLRLLLRRLLPSAWQIASTA